MSLLLEAIKAGLEKSHKQELLAINERIAIARGHLQGLLDERNGLLRQLDEEFVQLLDVHTAEQWQPADSLDQETADLKQHAECAHRRRLEEDESQSLPSFADVE